MFDINLPRLLPCHSIPLFSLFLSLSLSPVTHSLVHKPLVLPHIIIAFMWDISSFRTHNRLLIETVGLVRCISCCLSCGRIYICVLPVPCGRLFISGCLQNTEFSVYREVEYPLSPQRLVSIFAYYYYHLHRLLSSTNTRQSC